MFDSREYEWADVSVVIAGRNVTGIRSVQYKESQEKELLYAKGNRPHGMQHGNVSYEGSVSLLQSEVTAIEKAVGGSILRARMDIIVSYGNPSKGEQSKTDLLRGVEFTELSKQIKQGDKMMEIEIPFLMIDLVPNYV
ncbi:MAG: hypothetical protein ACTTGW_01275 [Candidatus Cryptobacteroides sp.]